MFFRSVGFLVYTLNFFPTEGWGRVVTNEGPEKSDISWTHRPYFNGGEVHLTEVPGDGTNPWSKYCL